MWWPTTGCQRCIECLELQVFFRKRVTNYRAVLQKITCSTSQCTALRNNTGWRRLRGCLIFAGNFPQDSSILGSSFAERDLQLKACYASSPLYIGLHMSHIWRSHVTRVNESRHTSDSVMSRMTWFVSHLWTKAWKRERERVCVRLCVCVKERVCVHVCARVCLCVCAVFMCVRARVWVPRWFFVKSGYTHHFTNAQKTYYL